MLASVTLHLTDVDPGSNPTQNINVSVDVTDDGTPLPTQSASGSLVISVWM